MFILADDVLILSAGTTMLGNFAKALNATHAYLHALGAKVAPDKSHNFTNNPTAAKWLRETTWVKIKSTLEVATDFRYLGAHITSKDGCKSGTLIGRLQTAFQQLAKLRHLPITANAKSQLIHAKIFCCGTVRS